MMPRKARGRQVATGALSIPEFCEAHSISQAAFYKMKRAGFGPAIMKVGARTLISIESAAEWRRKREAAESAAQWRRAREAGTEKLIG